MRQTPAAWGSVGHQQPHVIVHWLGAVCLTRRDASSRNARRDTLAVCVHHGMPCGATLSDLIHRLISEVTDQRFPLARSRQQSFLCIDCSPQKCISRARSASALPRFRISSATSWTMDHPTMSIDQPPAPAVDHIVPVATMLSRGRKRPLRTYSRRSAQARGEESEAPQPHQEPTTPTPDSRDATPDLGRAGTPATPLMLSEKEQAGRLGRGSILAYFKPLPSSSDKTPSDTTSSDPAEPPSTPPTSPLLPPLSRKRRRLTTRPQLSGLGQHSRQDGENGLKADDALTKDATIRARCSPSRNETTTIIVRTAGHDTWRPALSEVGPNTGVEYHDGPASTSAHRRPSTKRATQKRSTRDMTQTTLSLSIQKEPGFTVCGVCDLLYNPLNEKDRREHNRRHAAYSRNQKRAAA